MEPNNLDAVTGLYNRVFFMQRLVKKIKLCEKKQQKLTLIYIDIDNFKLINEGVGYFEGDILLKKIGKRIQNRCQPKDLLACLGGNEFAVMTHHQDPQVLQLFLDDLILKINQPYMIHGLTLKVTVSIGVAVSPDDAANAVTLLNYADQALRYAKTHGKNGYYVFHQALEMQALAHRVLLQELAIAIKEQQFEVYYQPIINCKTGEVSNAEALLRWNHPTKGVVNAEFFIAALIETPWIFSIDEWVVQQATRQLLSWHQKNKNFRVFVNVSPIQFQHADQNLSKTKQCLQQYRLSGHDLVFELTEDSLLDLNKEVCEKIKNLRHLGINIAIDDFGTGYSSYVSLKMLDLCYLKINHVFVEQVVRDPVLHVVCQSIVNMAHQLKLKVIAEDLETQEQYDVLKAMGCDYAQGFYFSKALPADEFEKKYLSGAL